MTRPPPPRDLDELRDRALRLEGATLGALASSLRIDAISDDGLRTKGKIGTLIELALGATAGSASVPDFPALGVELKTIPLGPRGVPRESTFVTSFDVATADTATWEASSVRRKLSHVLWVPIEEAARTRDRRIGRPIFFRPTAEQEAILRADFEDLAGLAAIDVERVTAHRGRWLQLRPKAKDGSVRTTAIDEDGERIATVPRGFYLRAGFTGAILRDPSAVPLRSSEQPRPPFPPEHGRKIVRSHTPNPRSARPIIQRSSRISRANALRAR